jgi:hypothetical protein
MKIYKTVKVLSPSALIRAFTSPYTFYIDKLTNISVPREPQNMAAAAGTAFDIEVKKFLIGLGVKSSLPIAKIEESLTCINIDEAKKIGKILFDIYYESGVFRDRKFLSVEKHLKGEVSELPIMGQLDTTVEYFSTGGKERVETVHDFKVSGYTSTSGVSPKPGYKRKYTSDINLEEGAKRKKKKGWDEGHKEYYEGIPFDKIDEMWALQFCMYGWLLHPDKYGEPFFVLVDSPIFNGQYKNIQIVQYEGIITPEFQARVMSKIEELFKAMIRGEWQGGLKNPVIKKYNPFAELDHAYMGMIGECWFDNFNW